MNETQIRERLHAVAADAPAPTTVPWTVLRRARARVALTVAASAAIVVAVIAGGAVGLRELAAPEPRPATPAPMPADEPTPPTGGPTSGPFARARGWIAYNDGTGIWAVDPGKAYPGTFSPTRFPDDAVRLAGPAAGDPIAWSADGSRLLVRRPPASFRYQRQTIFVLDADGTETRVTVTPSFVGASISPDGTQVVYAALGNDGSRLEVASVGGGSAPVVLRSSDATLGTPAFSPDGERIAYIEGGGDHSNALWVIDADGSNRRKVAGGDWSHVYDLVWSPDGERLAFNCRCPAGTGVYTIRADGSGLTLVSADEGMPMPQWSPDGSQIALVHQDYDVITVGQPTTATLVVVGADGGEERQLVHFELALLDGENPRRLTIAWNRAG